MALNSCPVQHQGVNGQADPWTENSQFLQPCAAENLIRAKVTAEDFKKLAISCWWHSIWYTIPACMMPSISYDWTFNQIHSCSTALTTCEARGLIRKVSISMININITQWTQGTNWPTWVHDILTRKQLHYNCVLSLRTSSFNLPQINLNNSVRKKTRKLVNKVTAEHCDTEQIFLSFSIPNNMHPKFLHNASCENPGVPMLPERYKKNWGKSHCLHWWWGTVNTSCFYLPSFRMLNYAPMATWYRARLVITRSRGSNPTQGVWVPMQTKCAIPPGSVNEYQWYAGE